MRLEDYLDFLEPDVIRLHGHRIGLEHVIEAYKEGETPEQIVAYYKPLSLEEVYAVIAYYLRNRDEVEVYLARVNAAVAEQERTYQPSPVMRRIRAMVEQHPQVGSGGDEVEVSS